MPMCPITSHRHHHHSPRLAACLAWIATLLFTAAAQARVVTVEEGSGAGFLLRQGGNCYIVLPTHLHGATLDGIRLGSDRGGGPIGTARIVWVAPDDADISLGVVRGGLAADCGTEWRRLRRALGDELTPGTELMLQRPRQQVFEGRRLILHSSGPSLVRLLPAPGESADLFGGTSGAVAFDGTTPVAMVLQAEDAGAALALRMDAIIAMLGGLFDGGLPPAPNDSTMPATADLAVLPPGDPVVAEGWTAHPVEGAVDPAKMIEGLGPWVFQIGEKPVSLTLRLTKTDRLSRIRLRSATGTGAVVPRGIEIVTDASTDPARPRPSSIPAPEMTPDGEFDLHVNERFARTVTITIRSSWGTGPVRLDAVSID